MSTAWSGCLQTAVPDTGQQEAPSNDFRVTALPLESAEHSGLQLAHSAKRSRRAPPAGPAGELQSAGSHLADHRPSLMVRRPLT